MSSAKAEKNVIMTNNNTQWLTLVPLHAPRGVHG
jgi:hypothetical protein